VKFKRSVCVSLVTGRTFEIIEPIVEDAIVADDIEMHHRTMRRVLFGPTPIYLRENLALQRVRL
jgi:hypothetical protein